MSITIARLRMRVSIPRRLSPLGSAIDQAVRRDLAPAVARAQVSRAPRKRVCRIRKLSVRIKVSPQDVKDAKLAALWAEEFSKVLMVAVDHGSGAETVSAESRADWLASFVLRLVTGDSSDPWAYEEFAALSTLPTGEAVVSFLESVPGEARTVLTLLDERESLSRVLAVLDVPQADRVVGVLDRNDPASDRRWTAADLRNLAELVIDTAPAVRTATPLASAARAIAAYLAQQPRSVPASGRYQTAGSVLHGLQLLETLCGLRRTLTPESFVTVAARAMVQLSANGTFRPEDFVGTLSPEDVRFAGNLVEIRSLGRSLDDVQRVIASAGVETVRRTSATWVDSAVAGLLLLVPIVIRLEWPVRIRETNAWRRHGPRALTYVLCGTAQAILNRPPAPDAVDPAVSLFAGWIGDPDLRGLARFVESTSIEERSELLRALLDAHTAEDFEADVTAAGATWASTFGPLGRTLVRRFAGDVRGFRQSSDRFVIDRFLATPGRILVEERRVLVALHPNSLWVAMRLSGADASTHSVGWLGDRSVEFELGGL